MAKKTCQVFFLTFFSPNLSIKSSAEKFDAVDYLPIVVRILCFTSELLQNTHFSRISEIGKSGVGLPLSDGNSWRSHQLENLINLRWHGPPKTEHILPESTRPIEREKRKV